tara:strand:- start:81 stop:1178 length:1098 start_codon:yes stop_codon:yes gene_type:complete
MKNNLLMFMPSIDEGGVENNLFAVSNYLKNEDVNIEILSCNYDKIKNFIKGTKFIGTKINFLYNRNKKIKYTVSLVLLFFNLLFRKDKTLVFAFQANIYAVIVAKLLNTKIIIRSNTAPSGWYHGSNKNSIYKFFISFADDVIVNSIEFKKIFDKKFNVKTECIYNPFNKKIINQNLKKKINIKFFDKKNLNILAVGRLTEQKDHLTILKSIKLLKSNFKLKLIIIGEGYNKNLLLNFINAHNLQNKISLVGYKKNPYPYIKKSDIIILTSKYEGLPNILLEAQYLKKYIISTNCPTGPKEILINGLAGDLVKIGDFKKISNLIKTYYQRKLSIRKKINYGYKNFSRFDYHLNCKKYLALIKKNF